MTRAILATIITLFTLSLAIGPPASAAEASIKLEQEPHDCTHNKLTADVQIVVPGTYTIVTKRNGIAFNARTVTASGSYTIGLITRTGLYESELHRGNASGPQVDGSSVVATGFRTCIAQASSNDEDEGGSVSAPAQTQSQTQTQVVNITQPAAPAHVFDPSIGRETADAFLEYFKPYPQQQYPQQVQTVIRTIAPPSTGDGGLK